MVTSFELPQLRELFYGGAFHAARGGVEEDRDPATGESLGNVAVANSDDVVALSRAAPDPIVTFRVFAGVPSVSELTRLLGLSKGA